MNHAGMAIANPAMSASKNKFDTSLCECPGTIKERRRSLGSTGGRRGRVESLAYHPQLFRRQQPNEVTPEGRDRLGYIDTTDTAFSEAKGDVMLARYDKSCEFSHVRFMADQCDGFDMFLFDLGQKLGER